MSARRAFALAALGGTGLGLYGLLVRGSLTVDLGLGRTVRPLGPLVRRIAALRELVFEVIAAPYLGRTPHALASKLRVLERGEEMVLAEHFTQVGPLVTTTLETVRFEPPERVHFRLVRGPAPYVVEQFELREKTRAPSSSTAASSAPTCGRSAACGVHSSHPAGRPQCVTRSTA